MIEGLVVVCLGLLGVGCRSGAPPSSLDGRSAQDAPLIPAPAPARPGEGTCRLDVDCPIAPALCPHGPGAPRCGLIAVCIGGICHLVDRPPADRQPGDCQSHDDCAVVNAGPCTTQPKAMARSRVSEWNAALTARRAAIGRRGACEKPPPPRLREPTVACVAGHCLLAREWLAPSFD